jgi:hypothetical protein
MDGLNGPPVVYIMFFRGVRGLGCSLDGASRMAYCSTDRCCYGGRPQQQQQQQPIRHRYRDAFSWSDGYFPLRGVRVIRRDRNAITSPAIVRSLHPFVAGRLRGRFDAAL